MTNQYLKVNTTYGAGQHFRTHTVRVHPTNLNNKKYLNIKAWTGKAGLVRANGNADWAVEMAAALQVYFNLSGETVLDWWPVSDYHNGRPNPALTRIKEAFA